ncbi:site-specific integrase [uncultured Polaribacter sp.]|uniref:site-specific integrase n=1 Tax=uncultured Polaribacter sp. TaxID=174711 RepID=UPI002620CA95|nr:site-specific integrase [uncultured Polaribacter sp.]
MNNYKITVLFVIQRNKMNKKGLCPLRCRITYKQKRKVFSTGVFINPENWDNVLQLAKPPNKNNTIINTQMSLINQKINEAFLMLQVLPESFDVDDIFRKYKGEDVKTEITILGAYDLHNDKTKKLIGVDFNELSWSRYVESRRKVAEFIRVKYKRSDMKLKQLDLKFIKDLEFYWKTEVKLKQATIYRSMQRFKKIIQFAIDENYLQTNPFNLYKNKKYKGTIVYLTELELNNLMHYKFSQKRLEKVRDMFVFCCYTGLAFTEMISLRTHHISEGFDGNLWINMVRQKTERPIAIPLLPQAKSIIEKYFNSDSEEVLPRISNQRFNSYIKEIGVLVGIDKKMSHHLARRTFATTILLYNNIPMEIVSELLGHSKMSITQESYAKVVQHKVSSQMNKLSKKLKKKG